jgi:hypothetical protein
MAVPKVEASATDTSTPTEPIDFHEAVIEGKKILKEIDVAQRGQLRLGELADQLQIAYGDRNLAKFAQEIDLAACTLARYRDVYRAWKNIRAPGRESPSYAVLRELATHPDREKIIHDDPKITKREAHDLMRKQANATKEKQEQDQWDDWLKHNRVWFKELCKIVNEAARTATVVDLDECTPEQQENLRQAVDPNLLLSVRHSGRMLIHTADRLAELCGLDPENDYDPIPVTPEAFQIAAE